MSISDEERHSRRKAAVRRYEASEKFQAAQKRYSVTEKFQAAQKRYRATEKGRANEAARGRIHGTIKRSRRRARLSGATGTHNTADWIVLCWASGWRCLYCGSQITEQTVAQEHRVPLARGGSNDIANIAVSCATCNLRKGTKTDVEFMALIASRAGTSPA